MTDAEIAAEVHRQVLKQERYMKRCSVCEKKYGLELRECCHRYLCDPCHGYQCKPPVPPTEKEDCKKAEKSIRGDQLSLWI